MSSFENTLSRMKDLYTYGKELNESSKSNAYTLEHSAMAADGKTYGIIRECNKYYIKSAPKGKETIAEAYEYIGGICNKKNYEYSSYNNALKNFELKMASINEACDGRVNISTLDPFKKGDFIVEGTEKMKDEIARQRQIMFNVSMLMNEGTEIGAGRNNDVVKFDGKQPEAETGKKGDECVADKKADAKPEYAGSKTNGVDKKVAPFNNNTTKCEDQLKEECECGSESCDCEKYWDGAKGLPSTPGVGEADSDHNNQPFNKAVNEEEDMEFADDVEGDDDVDVDSEGKDDFDLGTEDDMDFDAEGEDGLEGEDETDMDDDAEFDDDKEDFDVEGGDDDIMAQIEELQAQIDALKAQIEGGEEELDAEDDTDFDAEGEDDFGAEGDEFDDEESLDTELDAEDEDDFDTEGEDDFDAEDEDDFDETGNIEEGGFFHNPEYEDDEQLEDLPDEVSINEAKRRKMDSIVESVVNSILNEDEIHAWGKHPGYQKKPMELPSTGQDKNQWGEDWNDETVYSEQPFGTKIGDGVPFEKMVNAITKDVVNKLSEAINGSKKKVK